MDISNVLRSMGLGDLGPQLNQEVGTSQTPPKPMPPPAESSDPIADGITKWAFDKLDVDNNEKLSENEVSQLKYLKDAFKELDIDGDEHLSENELKAALSSVPPESPVPPTEEGPVTEKPPEETPPTEETPPPTEEAPPEETPPTETPPTEGPPEDTVEPMPEEAPTGDEPPAETDSSLQDAINDWVFDQLDANGDEGIDDKEAAKLPFLKALFELFDADGDGKIESKELSDAIKGTQEKDDAPEVTEETPVEDTPEQTAP